jgi:hypothetical protein
MFIQVSANWLSFFKLYSVKCPSLGFRISCFGFPGKGQLIGFVFSNSPIQLVSDPRFHGDKFTPAKAGVLRISGQRPAIGFVFQISIRFTLYFSGISP